MPFYVGNDDIVNDLDAYLREHYVESAFPEAAAGAAMPDAMMGAACAGMMDAPFIGTALEDEDAAPVVLEDKAFRSISMPFEAARSAEPKKRRFAKKAAAESARSLDDVIGDLDKSFMEMVFSFADARGISDVEVQKRANLDRKAFSKLKCGTTKNPSKATALALAIALQLNLDDTKDLLSRAGFALSPCSRQDLIVQYFIEHEAYDIHEINIALFEHGEESLGVRER